MLTAKAFAELIRVSDMTVRRYLKTGKIRKASTVKKGKRILIDPEKAIRDLKGSLEPTKQRAILPVQSENSKETRDDTFCDAVQLIAELGKGLSDDLWFDVERHLLEIRKILGVDYD